MSNPNSKVLESIKKSIPKVKNSDLSTKIVLISITVYIIVWSVISISRFVSLNATVFDLGLSMQRLWNVYSMPITLYGLFENILFNLLQFIIFPISFSGNYPILLIFQTIFLALPSFVLYKLSLLKIGDRTTSTLVSLSYLLYFPLAGINWFDFHFQAFFIFFFTLAYFLFSKGKLKIALFFFLLSGLVRFPFAIFPLIFSVTIIVELSISYLRGKPINKQLVLFSLCLISITFFQLVAGFFTLGNSIILHTDNASVHIALSGTFLTFVIIFLPVLFIPVFSARWLLSLSPFIYLVIFSGFWGYTYPGLLQLQYGSLYIPFIFLGIIDVLASYQKRKKSLHGIFHKSKIIKSIPKITIRQIITTIFLLILIFAVFYQPYSPMNGKIGDNYYLYQTLEQTNITQYNNLEHIISLIPKNDSNILIQNNLPQILPGKLGVRVELPSNIGPNVTMEDISCNSYPYNPIGYSSTVKIDYVLYDIESTWFHSHTTGFQGMDILTSMMLQSGDYGILAEANGLILLERGYSGPLEFYKPMSYSAFHLSQPFNWKAIFNQNNDTLTGFFWQSSILDFQPGTYCLNISLSVNNLVNTSNIRVFLYYGDTGYTSSQLKVLTHVKLKQNNSVFVNSSNFTAYQVYTNLGIEVVINSSNRDFQMNNVALKQVREPHNPAKEVIIGMNGTLFPLGTAAYASSFKQIYVPYYAIDANLESSWISIPFYGYLNLDFPSTVLIKQLHLALGSVPNSSFSVVVLTKQANNSQYELASLNLWINDSTDSFNVVSVNIPLRQYSSITLKFNSNLSEIRVNAITYSS